MPWEAYKIFFKAIRQHIDIGPNEAIEERHPYLLNNNVVINELPFIYLDVFDENDNRQTIQISPNNYVVRNFVYVVGVYDNGRHQKLIVGKPFFDAYSATQKEGQASLKLHGTFIQREKHAGALSISDENNESIIVPECKMESNHSYFSVRHVHLSTNEETIKDVFITEICMLLDRENDNIGKSR